MNQTANPRKIPEPAPLVIALDDMNESEAVHLTRSLSGLVWGVKVNDLLLRCGVELVSRLKAYGGVFCDPKLYDIPNTVANQVRLLTGAGADLVTLHCSGGGEMLRAAVDARQGSASLIGVTILTSMDAATSSDIYQDDVPQRISHFARLAKSSGLDGIVCAPGDLGLIDEVDPDRKLMRVTPGVRPDWHTKVDDQKRPTTPLAAWNNGADLLVVGRPVTGADDPVAACKRIVEELQGS